MSASDKAGVRTATHAGPEDQTLTWWRTVLGEYPTGVTLITSLDEQGTPVAMVVGTFNAVSQDPPLIGFMPNTDSTTFPAVAARGRFVANVLGAAHEEICRAFAQKHPDRFSKVEWVETESGIPRLANAVAWFDGSITDIHAAGDHEIVIAKVNDFGVGDADAGLPLLFLRGGYGTFTVPSLKFDAHGYALQLKIADLVQDKLQLFAEELDSEIAVCGLSGDTVVVLHAFNLKGGLPPGSRPVGASFPFAAPVAPSFAAWGTTESVKSWIENARHLTGTVDRAALTVLLEGTRSRGFAVSRGHAIVDDFSRVVVDPAVGRSELARIWQTIGRENEVIAGSELPEDATTLQFPIFDENGIASLVVVMTHFQSALGLLGVDKLVDRILGLSAELTKMTGGRMPEGDRRD